MANKVIISQQGKRIARLDPNKEYELEAWGRSLNRTGKTTIIIHVLEVVDGKQKTSGPLERPGGDINVQ